MVEWLPILQSKREENTKKRGERETERKQKESGRMGKERNL